MIEILKEKGEWDEMVGSFEHSDFYHTYDYHQLSKNDDELPVLIKYTENSKTIVLPLLIREIAGTTYTDATSVYGYTGPLTYNVSDSFDNSSFKNEFQTLCIENNIVSVFSRMNPMLPYQETVLKNIGEVATSGKVINIELTKSLEEQEQAYQKRLKTYINKARRLCTVKKASTDEEVLIFIEMYHENMRRLNAKQFYFFDKKYFFDLLKSTSFKTEILLALHNESEKIIGGALFVKKRNIVQYHLSGTREDFLFLNPIKLLIDEMRIIANQEKYTYFNLGGGVGGKDDSLFKFKSNFSKDIKLFKIWKYIVNEEIYQKLVEKKQRRECSILHKQYSGFFPSYRGDI